MLIIDNVHTYYGNSYILQGVSLKVRKGEVVTLLGRNGMGKSTTIKTVMGLVAPREGRVLLNGNDITGGKPYDIARAGVGFVPEDRRIFPSLSVLENLNLPVKRNSGEGWSPDKIFEFFPGLKQRSGHKGSELSGGEQQMLAIGRGLMAKPTLLCMDEPSLGLAPIVIEQLGETIKSINARGVTVLLVEQNVHLALGVANAGCALQVGKVVLQGDIETMKSSDIVKRAYLGG